MGWNHRVLAREYKDEVAFEIYEVYYDKKGKPNGYIQDPISVHGSSMKDLKWVLNKMKECLKKPILYEGKKFPREYKPKKKKN